MNIIIEYKWNCMHGELLIGLLLANGQLLFQALLVLEMFAPLMRN